MYDNQLGAHERCSHVVRLIFLGNMVIGLIVPLVVVVLVNEDCFKL